MIERHLFLMCIEAVLFLALFSFCLGWRRQPYNLLPTKEASASAKDTTSSQTFKKENKIKLDKIPLHKEDKKRLRQLHKHRRRNSVDATPPRPKGSQTIVTPTRSVDDLAIRLSGLLLLVILICLFFFTCVQKYIALVVFWYFISPVLSKYLYTFFEYCHH